ncbi:hypothetical protein CHS0354_011605, partial [Potamilus streckersoni]
MRQTEETIKRQMEDGNGERNEIQIVQGTVQTQKEESIAASREKENGGNTWAHLNRCPATTQGERYYWELDFTLYRKEGETENQLEGKEEI